MIVVVADGTELDGAEQVVGRAMRDWDPSIGGVAVFRCHVPEYRGGSVEVDALVCTPRGVTVVEVKGFTARQNGTLVTPANGPWKVGDDLAALYHPDRAPNPFLQVRRQVFATKNLLQRAGITGWVNAVITLLPQPWARVAYDETRLADGYRVLIADRNGCVALREYFRSEIGRTVRLSIDDVATVFHTLNLDHLLPSPEDLAAHGFPDEFQTVGDRRPAPERAAGPGFLAAIDRLGRGDSGSSADGREAGTTPETDTRPVINLRKDADIERELAADAAHGSAASRAAGSSNKIAVGSIGAGGTGAGTAEERASSGGDSGDDRDAPGAGDTGERTVPDPRETVRGVDGARPDAGDAPRATSPGDEAGHGRGESPAGEGGPAVDGTDREQGASRGRLRGIVSGVAAAGVIGAGAAALARKRRSAREGDAQADRSDDGTDVDRAAEPRADHPTERPAELDRAAPGAESDDGLDVSGGEDTGARATALDVPGDGDAGAPDTAGTRAAVEAASAAAGTRTAAETDTATGGDGQDNDTADRRSVDTETRTPPETDTATAESGQDNDTADRRGVDTGAAGRSAGERRANDGRGGEPAEADAAGDREADTHGDARQADSHGDGRDRKQAADARVAATETDDAPDRGGRAPADSADGDVEEDDDGEGGRTLRGVAAGAALAGAVGAGVLAARAARSRRDDDHDRDQDQDQDQDRDRLDGRDLGSERDDTERTSSDEGRSPGADGDEWGAGRGDARRIAPEEDRFPDADSDAHAAGRDHAERNAPERERFPDTSTDERDTGRDHTRGTASEEGRHSDHAVYADYADHADGDDDERGAGWRGERQRDDRDESGRRYLGAWRAPDDDERDDADGYAVDADDHDGRDHDDASGYDDREPGTDPDDGRAYDDSPGGHFHARTADGEFDHVDGAFQQLRGEPVPSASGGAQWWQPNQPAPAPKWRPELPGFVRGRGRSGPGRAGRAAKVARQAPARRRPRIGPGIGLVLVLVLFGATFYGVTAVAASRFVVADYDRLCGDETKTFPKAAEFADAGARPVRLAGDLAGMVPAGGPAWHPEDPGEVQLVACLRQTGMGDLVQTCWYPPSEAARVARTVNLFRATYQLVVYEARTRREVARADLVGERYSDDPASTEPDRCRAAASAPDVLGRRLGQPSSGQVTAVLAPLVRDR
ncbi:NERD domain-containing protein [Nocardia thailandica]|uniref:NERD domain-containing protein n=1 Tax=Nocardia thailandica TaxID=257275 RepID=UPI00030AC94E|nr:NERD domain-containing protein [Nocardia thailandica]